MKKGIGLLIFLLFAVTVYSQGLKFNSFSISPFLGFYDNYSPEKRVGGFACNADISFAKNKNIFSVYVSAGIEFKLNITIVAPGGGETDRAEYDEINLLYGREFRITNWFKLETHAGLGRIHIKVYEPYRDYVSLGVPLRPKTLIYIGKHFSFGFNPNVNFSKDFTTSSFCIIFQYKL